MKELTLTIGELRELSATEQKDLNGGYGYHSSNAPGAEAVGKAFWDSVGAFWDGFVEGYNNARRPQH